MYPYLVSFLAVSYSQPRHCCLLGRLSKYAPYRSFSSAFWEVQTASSSTMSSLKSHVKINDQATELNIGSMVLKANSLTTGICAHLKTISHEEINV
jgi:hypothetical protein